MNGKHVYVVVAFALVVGCSRGTPQPTAAEKGTSTGPRVSATVGAAGGKLSSTDGRLELIVPAGALASDTELTLEPITNTAPGGIGGAFRLGPEGTRFSQPATVSIAFSAADLEGSSTEALFVGYQSSDGFWHTLGEPTVEGQRVSVKTKHLSDWSALLGWQLRPPSASTPTNGTVGLTLRYCEPETFETMEDELVALTPRCDLDDELPHLVTVNVWSVNGQPGGTPADGTLAEQGVRATYNAPGQEPQANPVAVQVEFNRRKKKQLAVSNITVGNGSWTGTVSWTLTGTSNETVGQYQHTYTVTGGGSVSLKVGQAGVVEYRSGDATYGWSHEERYNNTYTAGACTRSVMQTRRWTLSGTSANTANLGGVLVDEGAQVTLTFAVPGGPASGRQTTNATETASGDPSCQPPAPTNTDVPYEGTMPNDSLQVSMPVDPSGKMLSGMKTVTVGELPPRQYAVTWTLQR